MAYSQKEIESIFNDIVKLISEDGLSLRKAIDKNNISTQTFYRWLEEDAIKSKRYARATEIRADRIFDEILDISDSQEGDVYEDSDGVIRTNHDIINRARLRVDSRKWILSKMNPKKYSDKIQVDTTEFREQPLFPE